MAQEEQNLVTEALKFAGVRRWRAPQRLRSGCMHRCPGQEPEVELELEGYFERDAARLDALQWYVVEPQLRQLTAIDLAAASNTLLQQL